MKRPAFQFYPGDWRNNANLRRCAWAARGVWVEVMGLMHDSDEYGVLRWTLREIGQALGCPMPLLNELVRNQVLKGADTGGVSGVTFTPKHSRTEGATVAVLAPSTGPVWFSSRMVVDEYKRIVRGTNGEAPNTAPKPTNGEGIDTSPSRAGASSSSSPTGITGTDVPAGGRPPRKDPVRDEIWAKALPMLQAQLGEKAEIRSYLGKLCKDWGEVLVLEAVRDAVQTPPLDARAWLVARCQERRAQASNKSAALEQRNAEAVAMALKEAGNG